MPMMTTVIDALDRFLQGTCDHYSWYLPAPLKPMGRLMMKLIFSHVSIEEDQLELLRKLPKNAAIVYVTKHKSQLERLFFHFYTNRHGLPCPEIAFFYRCYLWQPLIRLVRILVAHLVYFRSHFKRPDPFSGGYIAQQMAAGRPVMLSLVETDEFYRRYVQSQTDPLRFLVELGKTLERPIWLVPQLIFYGTRPVSALSAPLVGTDPRPSLIRKLWKLILNPEKILVEISEPINLQRFLINVGREDKTVDAQAMVLRHRLLSQITRHRQSITGPILKPAEEIKQHLLTNERLRTFMRSWARRRNMSIPQVQKEALQYVDEIAARPSPLVVKFGMGAVRWMLDNMFEGVDFDQEGFNAVRRASRNGPLIMIPCHKSHVDYLVISYLMHRNNLPCPHIFAGANLAFWPMGPIFRRLGAFFVRRSFSGAVFYAKVFSEYIHMLLGQGFNIEVFIEGTRSRNGKLLLPKLGMLSILLSAIQNGACRHVTFVPIYIGYDRVPEVSSYLQEVEGGQKEPESFWQMIRARKVLKKRFGKIYIKFCTPIALKDLENEYGAPVPDMRAKEVRALTRDLGDRVLRAIDRRTVVTPQALVAAAVLNSAHKVISRERIDSDVDTFMSFMEVMNVSRADTLMMDSRHAVSHVVSSFIQQKILRPVSKADARDHREGHFHLTIGKRPTLDYYKNSGIGPFVPAALTSLAILAGDAFQFASHQLYAQYGFLQNLFQNEFASGNGASTDTRIRKTIKAFIADAILVPHPKLPDTYNLTSEGFRKLKCFAGLIAPFLESYLIVLQYFLNTTQPPDDGAAQLKQIQQLGVKLYKRQEVIRKEALSRINYLNAVDYYLKRGLKRDDGATALHSTVEAIRVYIKHLPL
ncbi:MAG: 1-acyl-sn-glycerol-3-phosphate acyltransferase [Desulfobacterales bacterium]|jgi:glycerol-3-phosphate O-acyltransferase